MAANTIIETKAIDESGGSPDGATGATAARVLSAAGARRLAQINGWISFLAEAGVLPPTAEAALRAAQSGLAPTSDALWMALGLAALAGARPSGGRALGAGLDTDLAAETEVETKNAARAMAAGILEIQKQWPAPAEAGNSVGSGSAANAGLAAKNWALFRSWCETVVNSKIGAPECGMLQDPQPSIQKQKAWAGLAKGFEEIAPALREAWRALSAPAADERPLGASEALWLGTAARILISLRSGGAAREGLLRWPSLASADCVEAGGFRRESVLVWALEHSDMDIAWLVLDRSPPESADSRGSTALIHAARHGETKMAIWLAERCDARRVDENGMDAFQWACTKGREKTAEALLPWADLSKKNAKWGDLLDLSLCSNEPSMLEWMIARWPAEDWLNRRAKMAREAVRTQRWAAAQWIGSQLDPAQLTRFSKGLTGDERERMPELASRVEAVRQAQAMREEIRAVSPSPLPGQQAAEAQKNGRRL